MTAVALTGGVLAVTVVAYLAGVCTAVAWATWVTGRDRSTRRPFRPDSYWGA